MTEGTDGRLFVSKQSSGDAGNGVTQEQMDKAIYALETEDARLNGEIEKADASIQEIATNLSALNESHDTVVQMVNTSMAHKKTLTLQDGEKQVIDFYETMNPLIGSVDEESVIVAKTNSNGVVEFFKSLTPIAVQTALITIIDSIKALIPTQANATNQLADKAFVNSSISNMAARFLSPDVDEVQQFQGLVALRSGLWFYNGASVQPSINDIAIFVVTQQDIDNGMIAIPGEVWRATYNPIWTPQYKVNDTPFTAAQIAALNSGITALMVAKLGELPTNAELAALLTVVVSTHNTDANAHPSFARKSDIPEAVTVGLYMHTLWIRRYQHFVNCTFTWFSTSNQRAQQGDLALCIAKFFAEKGTVSVPGSGVILTGSEGNRKLAYVSRVNAINDTNIMITAATPFNVANFDQGLMNVGLSISSTDSYDCDTWIQKII